MSSQLLCKVLVFVSLHFYANAYMTNYPYPYPYAQQYDYNYQPSLQQIYPQIPIQSYGQQMYPQIPIQSYGQPMYPIYPNYPPMHQTPIYTQIPQSSFPPGVSHSQGIPTPPSTGIPQQGGIYPAPFPYMPQTYVPTPYGNIPVEIIDVNPNEGNVVFSQRNETETEASSTETSFTEEKKDLEIIRKPVITSSIVQSSPQSTTITRTLDPQASKIDVIVQTSKPPLKKQDNSIEKDDGNIEDNEATTKKFFGLWH